MFISISNLILTVSNENNSFTFYGAAYVRCNILSQKSRNVFRRNLIRYYYVVSSLEFVLGIAFYDLLQELDRIVQHQQRFIRFS